MAATTASSVASVSSLAGRQSRLAPPQRQTVAPFLSSSAFSRGQSALRANATSARPAGVEGPSLRHVAPQAALVKGKSYGVHKVKGSERPVMEDRVATVVEGEKSPSFFAVFDGHGGAAVAEFLEKELWPAYKKAIETALSKGTSLERATLRAYEEVDKRTLAPPKGFFGMMMERGMGGPKCGACANTAVILPQPDGSYQLVAANVGDSHTYLSRAGEPVKLSEDHKPNIEAERMRIERKNPTPGQPLVRMAGGEWRVGGLLALSRAFGDVYLKDWSDGTRDGARGGFGLTAEPYVTVLTLAPGDDWLIMGSDGLWDAVKSQEAVDLCRKQGPDAQLDAVAAELIGMAQKRGSTDDISAVVVRLPTADAAPAAEQ
ncbi:unnamed protein product [Closterium sp. NIES-64]|nr:unnamed protein product [Closterium sp. NIES-65]CAI5975809.1 unnamed protein product [Closterium sp. NIES-64]